MSWRRRECRRIYESPLAEGQSPHAADSQSIYQCRNQAQRKHLRDSVSPLSASPGTQASHRGDCPPTLSTGLADSAQGGPLRRTGSVGEPTVQKETHGADDPGSATPWLSGGTAGCSSGGSGGGITEIFDPALHFAVDFKRSGRLSPSPCSWDFCSSVGSVIRRKRISRPSVVGRTMSALCSVESNASAFIGEKGWALSTPLAEGCGTIGRRCSRCFSVTHKAYPRKATRTW